jgi:DNA-directed RNA polymerase subunit RPC12/RpoP
VAIRFYCVSCGQKIKAQDDMSGLKIACPTCNDRQTVPQPAPGTKLATGPRADHQPLKLAAHFDPDDFTSAAKGYHHDRRNPLVDDHSEPLNKVKKKRILRGSFSSSLSWRSFPYS